MSAVPLVVKGQTDPLVGKVRVALNVPGGNQLDAPLMEVVRGVQRANGISPHGELDEDTLNLFDLINL
jgi:hypothetical protein